MHESHGATMDMLCRFKSILNTNMIKSKITGLAVTQHGII